MKKQYSRKRKSLLSPSWILALVGVGMFFVLTVLARTFAPGVLITVVSPGLSLGTWVSERTYSFVSSFSHTAEVVHERDRLLEENQALQNTNRTLVAKVEDITHLTGTSPTPSTRIFAGILARPPVSPYDTLLIDTLGHTGLHNGAHVYGPGNVPLGTLEAISGSHARVKLYSFPGEISNGWVGEKRIPITLTGVSAGAFTATLSRQSGVAVNDVVYLPGPGALAVGSISSIDSDPSSPQDAVHIVPYTNIFSLTWVEIEP